MPLLHEYFLAEGIRAFSTTREGGVSEGNYAFFNVNANCGDTIEHVIANKKALAGELGVAVDHIIIPHQVHGKSNVVIDEDFFNKSEVERHDLLEGVDTVMTCLPGVCIGVSTADCVPILLCDTAKGVVCAVHAGWRGTVVRAVQTAIEDMRLRYQTRASDVRAVIGPCISLECFEVGDEVYERFREAGFDMESIARKYGKWHIDLPECNRLQLIASRVLPQNIQCAHICTYQNSSRFFSARKLGIASGRIFNGILRQES